MILIDIHNFVTAVDVIYDYAVEVFWRSLSTHLFRCLRKLCWV